MVEHNFRPFAMNTRLTSLPLAGAILMVVLGATSAAAAGDTPARWNDKPLDLSVPKEAEAWVGVRTKAREAEPQRAQREMLARPDQPLARKPYGAGYEARTSGTTPGTPRASETGAMPPGTARGYGPPASPGRPAGRGPR